MKLEGKACAIPMVSSNIANIAESVADKIAPYIILSILERNIIPLSYSDRQNPGD